MLKFLEKKHCRDVGEAVLEASKGVLGIPVAFTQGFLSGSHFYGNFCEEFDDIWDPHVWPGNITQCAFLERHFRRMKGDSVWHKGYQAYYIVRKLPDAHVTRFGILMGVYTFDEEPLNYQ